MDIIFLMLKICIDNLRCKTKLRYSNEMERIDYTANCVDHWLTTVCQDESYTNRLCITCGQHSKDIIT